MNSSFVRSVGTSSIGGLRHMSPFVFKTADSAETDVYDCLRSDMGEKRYTLLEECESLTLANVYIRSTRLGAGEGAGRSRMLNHDAAVVELQDVQKGTLFRILAEKAMADDSSTEEEQRSGIFIHWKHDFRFRPDQDVRYECFSRPIRLRQVLHVLKKQPTNYDTIVANCWQYAAVVVCDLVKILRDSVEDFDVNVRASLERVLHAAEMRFHNANTIIPYGVGMGSLLTTSVISAIGVGVGVYIASRQPCTIQEEDEKSKFSTHQ